MRRDEFDERMTRERGEAVGHVAFSGYVDDREIGG